MGNAKQFWLSQKRYALVTINTHTKNRSKKFVLGYFLKHPLCCKQTTGKNLTTIPLQTSIKS